LLAAGLEQRLIRDFVDQRMLEADRREMVKAAISESCSVQRLWTFELALVFRVNHCLTSHSARTLVRGSLGWKLGCTSAGGSPSG
jgi:hypothetical protein